MNPLKRFATKAAQTVLRQLTVREPDGWYSSAMKGAAGEVVTDQSVLALSAVWGCVNLICGTTASLPVMVYQTKGDRREVALQHPLYKLLHESPNYDQTAVDFWEFISASLELWGNAYARVVRQGSKVVALVPVAPALMSVRRLANGSIEYSWTKDGQRYVEIEAEMLHIRGFGGDPLGGMSTLQFGRNVFSLAQAVDRAAGTTFRNGLRPSGVLTFEKYLTPEQREAAETHLTEKFLGAMNAGRPLILEGGTTWSQLTISPEDAQMLESRGFSVEEICRFFGVPPFMIGHTEKSTSWGTGLEQQTLGFQKFTLRRRLKRIEQALEKQLLTARDRADGISIEFNIEGLLRADSAGRAKFYQQMTAIGAMTINEVRALENLPPVEGGDVPRMQMQNVPIDADPSDETRALPPPGREG
ncbi:Phage portal protein [Methyloligella halotolerans]|uniref:Phage portal protein n=1 Tax=Methyloligella halotolerans TaxID=1177755 RepID=A0A1E2RZM2_9HYPH|nr:phage portal protein [Methyloligella halotolerans]ODA67664.1 Phage portal protein [Methyloligella halotolerans]